MGEKELHRGADENSILDVFDHEHLNRESILINTRNCR
jgi:hypothetical protein